MNNISERLSNSGWSLVSISIVFVMIVTTMLYVHIYGVNVPYWDEWELIYRFQNIYYGKANWWSLATEKHTDHMIGFAFISGIFTLLISDFDSKIQMLCGVFIQTIAFFVLIYFLTDSVEKEKRSLWISLSSIIFFSISQYKNYLWAFQTAWFIVSLLLVIAILGIKKTFEGRSTKNGWYMASLISAFFAAFTSTQGVLIWPTIMFLLFAMNDYKVSLFVNCIYSRMWFVASIVTGAIFSYLWISKGIYHPDGAVDFSYFALLYNFIGIHGEYFGDLGARGVIFAGLIILFYVAIAFLKVYLTERSNKNVFSIALMFFGLFFVFMISIGRSKFGLGAARDSHYAAYLTFTFVGVLTILFDSNNTKKLTSLFSFSAKSFPIVIVIAFLSSSFIGLQKGIEWRRNQGMSAIVLKDYKNQPDFVLKRLLFGDPGFVRRNAEFMEQNGLGLFAEVDSVPMAVKSFEGLPKSMLSLVAKYPDKTASIYRAWHVYIASDDLIVNFNNRSDAFSSDYLAWCVDASVHPSHHMSTYLSDYKDDYVAIVSSMKSEKK